LLGGVACRNQFNLLNKEAFICNLYNVYSYNDEILPYAEKPLKQGISPCGLGPILTDFDNVKNIDATNFVGKHEAYFD